MPALLRVAAVIPLLVPPLIAASSPATGPASQDRRLPPYRSASADTLVLPHGWRPDGRIRSIGIDSTRPAADGAPSVRLVYDDTAAYAGVVARLDVQAWRGRTVRLTGAIASSSDAASAGVWLGAWDSTGTRIAYRNSYEDRVVADPRWTTRRVDLAIPPQAVRVLIGAAVYEAPATFWVASLRVTPGGEGAP
ncbi:MAG: hypothetical protein MUF53_10345 [Gemmatimonadaceae bacterium]|jgi:hypothetical protein|nr:hypothetical protein [Gemmatimonadaceae bacterium]